MSLLLPEIAMRGTESQDRVVATRNPRRAFLRRYGVVAGLGLALLLLVAWSARAWLSSDKIIPRARMRTAIVERGPFVRDVAATGIVVAAVSPTLFAEAPGTIIYKVRAGDTVKAGDVLGSVDSASLTNEYERERATLVSSEAALNRQAIEVRRSILKSSQDTDLAKVQITAAEREFKRAEDAWNIHVIPQRDFERARDDLETAKLNYAHAMETGGLEKDSLQLELRSQRAQRDAQALKAARLHDRVEALTLKSPVAGMVATLSQPERAQVAENAPLVTVVDLSALEIEFQVAESYANEIRSGMNAEITLDGRKLIGTVAGISPDVRNSQVTGRVRFTEQPKALRQNQRASVRIVLDERNDVLKVARSPFNDSDTHFVYVVHDDSAVRVPVEFGAAAIGEIEIRNGLTVGDTVVLADMRDYKDAPSVLIGN
ncbi:MAG TPA: HlyD family efflux transporter periplasmic adaptor subunit [Steroidobacteraceae bacterium]|jgi:HlyD family secretion protein|nr:HlyD family efflux transporter periplasmic adaptor subunit [Steroidobacteraceae bacterium]